MSKKGVYLFREGNATMRDLLGGKGANLAEMTNIGLPVPAGFTITTEVCTYYYEHGKTYPPELKSQVAEALKKTEEVMGAKFGDAKNPLLVSCRSGARVSMPGIMATVRTSGLTDGTLPARLGHGRQHLLDGLRQHGRRQRHRRRLHPRPGHRRKRLLRRVPHQRPGRRRRRRHPHPQEDRRAAKGHAGGL